MKEPSGRMERLLRKQVKLWKETSWINQVITWTPKSDLKSPQDLIRGQEICSRMKRIEQNYSKVNYYFFFLQNKNFMEILIFSFSDETGRLFSASASACSSPSHILKFYLSWFPYRNSGLSSVFQRVFSFLLGCICSEVFFLSST